MKLIKKSLAVLLSVMMVLSAIPFTSLQVFAAPSQTCTECLGSGEVSEVCTTCGGLGTKTCVAENCVDGYNSVIGSDCTVCGGTGEVTCPTTTTHTCDVCGGSGQIVEDGTFAFDSSVSDDKFTMTYSDEEQDGPVAQSTAFPSESAKYSSDNELVAQVDENTGKIMTIKPGTATITAKLASDGVHFLDTEVSYELTVEKATQTIKFDNATENKLYGQAVSIQATEVGTKHNSEAIAYSFENLNSSDLVSAIADDGTITFNTNKVGKAKITATKATDDYYKQATASYVLDVQYLTAPTEAYTIETTKTDNWYNDASGVVVKAPAGYEIAKENALSTTFSDTVTITDEAKYNAGDIKIALKDSTGAITDMIDVEAINYDKTAPAVPTISYPSAVTDKDSTYYYGDSTTVTLSSSDTLSGVAKFDYDIDGTTNTVTATDGEATFTIDPEFKGSVTNVIAYDVAGNASSAMTSDGRVVVVDKTTPGLTVTYEDPKEVVGDNIYYGKSFKKDESDRKVNVTFEFTEANFYKADFGSNGNTISVNGTDVVANGTWTGDTFTYGLPIDGVDDEFTFYAKYTDRSGNAIEYNNEATKKVVIVDNTDPVISLSYSGTGTDTIQEKYFKANQTVTVKIDEKNFDPTKVNVEITKKDVNGNPITTGDLDVDAINNALHDSANWTNSGISNTATFALTDSANYSIKVTCTDIATNEAELTDAITIDKTQPEVTISYSESLGQRILQGITFGIYKAKATVTVTVNDTISPVSNVTYSATLHSGVSTVNTAVAEQSANYDLGDNAGSKTVEFDIPANFRGDVNAKATDMAGNETSVTNAVIDGESTSVLVDNIKPVIADAYDTAQNTVGDTYYYNTDSVDVTLTIDEANFDFTAVDGDITKVMNDAPLQVKVNGETVNETLTWAKTTGDNYQTVVTLTDEGDYDITVDYTDVANNVMESFTSKHIVIDRTKPTINVAYSGDSTDPVQKIRTIDGRDYYNAVQTATVTINEKNFDATKVTPVVTIQDVDDNNIETSLKSQIEADLKDPSKWISSGATNTCVVELSKDANYTIKIDCEDLATNKTNPPSPEVATTYLNEVTVDTTAPIVNISYSASLGNRILEAITFGIYEADVTATITVEDATTPIYKLSYEAPLYANVSDVNTAVAKKSMLYNDTETFTKPTAGKAEYEFTIAPQFRGYVTAQAWDRADNKTKVAKDESGANNILVDNIKPTIAAEYDAPQNSVSNTYYYNENSVKVTLTIDEANFNLNPNATGAVMPYANVNLDSTANPNDDDRLVVTCKYKKNTQTPVVDTIINDQLTWTRVEGTDKYQTVITLSDEGDYDITVDYTDVANNEMESFTSKHIVIDRTKPVINVKYDETDPDLVLNKNYNPYDTDAVLDVIDDNTIATSDYSDSVIYFDNYTKFTVKITEANFNFNLDSDSPVLPYKDPTKPNDADRLVITVFDEDTGKEYTVKPTWTRVAGTDDYYATIDLKTQGKHYVKVQYVDIACNDMDPYTSQDIVIDKQTPEITKFEFSTTGYYKDEYKENGTDNTDAKKNRYDYYFEKGATVTVSATDRIWKDESKKNYILSSGVQDIVLLAYDVDKQEFVKVTAEDIVRGGETVDDVFVEDGTATRTFNIKSTFKGNIYAIAVDRLNQYPTTNDANGKVRQNVYKDKMVRFESFKYNNTDNVKVSASNGGFVAPYDSIIENKDLHRTSSGITITVPDSNDIYEYAKAGDSDRYYSSSYISDALSKVKTLDGKSIELGVDNRDRINDFHPESDKVPLYKSGQTVKFEVEDKYSGIRQIDWFVIGNQDADKNQVGKATFNNNASAKETVNGWNVEATDNNLVTKASKEIKVTNNSNDIIILVVLTDRVGNKTYDYSIIGIDKTRPVVELQYSDNDKQTYNYSKYFNEARTVTIKVTERNFDASTINDEVVKNIEAGYNYVPNTKSIKNRAKWYTKNGDTSVHYYDLKFVKGDKNSGTFDINFECTDFAGNTTKAPTKDHFVIDYIAPKITVSFDNNDAKHEKYFNKARTATITIKEHIFDYDKTSFKIAGDFEDKSTAELNKVQHNNIVPRASKFSRTSTSSDVWTTNLLFSGNAANNGDFTLDYAFTDRAGNKYAIKPADFGKSNNQKFTIDTIAPTLEIIANDNYAYPTAPTVKVTQKDNNCYSIDGHIVGTYYKDGKFVDEPIGASASTSKDHELSIDAEFAKLETDGFFVSTANCEDMAGNKATAPSKTFVKNQYGSVYVPSPALKEIIGGYVNYDNVIGTEEAQGKLYVTEYSPSVVDTNEEHLKYFLQLGGQSLNKEAVKFSEVTNNKTDANWYQYQYTLDNDLLIVDGEYELFISSTSKRGEEFAENNLKDADDAHKVKVNFTVDSTKPKLTISGLENHNISKVDKQTVTLSIVETNLNTVKAIVKNTTDDKVVTYVWSSDKDYVLQENEQFFGDIELVDGNIELPFDLSSEGDKKNYDVELLIVDHAGNVCLDADNYNKNELFTDTNVVYVTDNTDNGEVTSIKLTDILVTKNSIPFSDWAKDHPNEATAVYVAIAVAVIAVIAIPILIKRKKKLDKEDENLID